LGWALPALRWALYTDLCIVFGVPMAAALTQSRGVIVSARGVIGWASGIGIAVSLGGFLLTAANMAGIQPTELDRGLVLPMLTGTAVGAALMVRCVALAVCAWQAMFRAPTPIGLPISPGAVAVATLAWSGHAAASLGVAGWARLAGDIVHLLGAHIWVGTLMLFAGTLLRPLRNVYATSTQTAEALSRFAFSGSVIVAVLAASGVANILFLVALPEIPRVIRSFYGRLLLFKLALFLAMLGLAALNRFALVPSLAQPLPVEARHAAIRKLRISVSLELLTALTVLALVAWLGALDPLGNEN